MPRRATGSFNVDKKCPPGLDKIDLSPLAIPAMIPAGTTGSSVVPGSTDRRPISATDGIGS